MGNICRPFVLYNDFLPPNKEQHKDWQYLSFGYYDGISVEDNLFTDDESNLIKLWEFYVKNSEKTDGSFSSNVIFGLRSEEIEGSNHIISDKEIWKDDVRKEYPFVFISLIQLDKEKNSLQEVWNSIDELEQEFTISNQTKAISYLTFDNSDIILVLLCKNYSFGVNIINRLHTDDEQKLYRNIKIKYSFTVSGIYKKFLNDDECVKNLSEKLSKVYIYMIEKEPGSLKNVYLEILRKLGKKCVKSRESVLGCNDEVIMIENVPCKKFLLLFRDKTGILNHSSDGYYNNLIGVTTIIGKRQSIHIDTGNNISDFYNTKNDRLSLCEEMRNKCKVIKDNGIRRNLYQIINSLQKFETTPFNDYLFQSAIKPLNVVLDMVSDIENKSKNVSEIERGVRYKNFIDSFYKFMKGFGLYVQDTGCSDRQFTQTPDFNIRICDAPVKINAFYNAFIYNVKMYLNSFAKKEDTEQHEYEFLTCIGVTDNTNVKEYFKKASDRRRLFLVEIPEYQIYNPKMMMVILAHEVGHIVGKEIRNREERLDYLIQCSAKIVVICMYNSLKKFFENKDTEFVKIQNDEYWKKLYLKIYELLNRECNTFELLEARFSKINANEEFKEFWKKRRYYSIYVKLYFKDIIVDILNNKIKSFWEYLIKKDYLYWINISDLENTEKHTEELKNEIYKVSNTLTSYNGYSNDALSITSSLEIMFDFFIECIADLISIMTLKLSFKDYLNAIVDSATAQDLKLMLEPPYTEMIIRSSLVTDCMCYGNGFIWDEGDLISISENDGNINKIRIRIQNCIDDCLGENCYKSEFKFKKNIDIFLNKDILDVISEYLKRSKEIFTDCNENNKKKMQVELINVYKLFDGNDIEKLVLEMQQYIENYLHKIKYTKGEDKIG